MSQSRVSHHNQSPPAPSNMESGGQGPLFNVVNGNPSAEELAALTAVVLGLSTPAPAPASKQRTRSWIRRRQLRLHPAPGPGAWRRSGR